MNRTSRHRWVIAVLPLLALLVAAQLASADIVVLTDGTRLDGDLKKTDDGYLFFDARTGKATRLREGDIRSIELVGRADSNPVAALQSLRRAAEALNDLKSIIDRYQRFIDQHKGTPVGDEAARDLAGWKQKLADGYVRIANRWVTPAERDALLERSIAAAGEARIMIAQGRLKEADTALAAALQVDPASPTLNYLRGLIFYKQEQFPQAKKAFEAALAAAPGHAPTLNNLAAVLFRTRAYGQAMVCYDQAMLARPNDRMILDNIAEALHGVPDDQRNSTPAQRATRHFTEQDTQLQAAMRAQQGLYRWGATWVSASEQQALREAEKEVRKRLDELAGDYEATRQRIAAMDREMAANEQTMRDLDANSYVRDANGNLVRLQLPNSYYDLRRRNDELRAVRVAEVAKLDQLQAQARAVQQRLPTPKFLGLQQLFGPEYAPILPPPPTTGPAPTTTRS